MKILITYAGRFGSTRGVAETIAEVLCRQGAVVDVKRIRQIEEITRYNAVVVGSAIHYDQWMNEARTFVREYKNDLMVLPVAYFFTCLVLSRQTEKTKRQARAYAEALLSLVDEVTPVSIGRFAGVLDYGRMPFLFRLVARVIFGIKGVAEGDYRDWEHIRSWAADLRLGPEEK